MTAFALSVDARTENFFTLFKIILQSFLSNLSPSCIQHMFYENLRYTSHPVCNIDQKRKRKVKWVEIQEFLMKLVETD